MDNSDPRPLIEVVGIIESDDGTVTATFDTNDAFDKMVKDELGVNEITQEQLGAYILDMLNKAAEEEDGYSFASEDS